MRTILSLALLLLTTPVLAQTASLSVSNDHVDPVPAGAPITFVLYANNEGPDDAANTQLTFTLPAEATFDSLSAPAGWSCTTGQTVTCSTAALPPGSAQFTIVATTDPALPPQTITATASVSSTTSDPETGDNSIDISVIIIEDLDVAVSLSDAPDPVAAGSDLTYTIAVTNNGPSAGDVTLTVTPPPALTQVSFTGTGWTCGSFTCTRTDMPPGTETLTLVAHVDPSTPAGPVTTSAHIDAADSVPANNDDSETTQVVVDTDIAVTKTSAGATPGGHSWTITVSSSGPSNAASVTLTDVIPPGAAFASLTAPAGWTCGTPAVGASGTVTCTTPSLPPASPAVFQLETTGALPANTATVSSPSDSDPGNNSATASTSAELSVAITDAPDPVQPASPIVYTVTATNAGPDAATAASITFTPSPNLTIDSITPPAGWSCIANTCTNALFAAGSEAFTVQATSPATPGAVATLQATITSGAIDTNPADDTATETTTVAQGAHVTGTKTASGTANPGATITFTITLTNDGLTAQPDNPGDELTDVLPSGLTLVDASATSGTATANVGTNTVTWNGAIPTGSSVIITIHATVDADASGALSNQATFSYDSNGDGTNDTTGTTNTAAPAANAQIPSLSPLGLTLLAAALASLAMMTLRRL